MNTEFSFLETLEDRIAPAAVTTFSDIDGDTVQVSSSKGTKADLDGALTVTMGQLELVDVTAALFKGANITIKVIERGSQGDGSVNVGVIDGTGVDLGKVTVGGDLGQILAGDSDYNTAGLKGLYVNSMGVQGMDTGATNFVSEIKGSIGSVVVLGDLFQAGIVTHNGASAGKGDIKSLYVGGNLTGGDMESEGSVRAEGNVGKAFVGGDIVGGSANYTGTLMGHQMKSITVQGDIVGVSGAFIYNGVVYAGSMGKTYIGGSLYGADTDATTMSGSLYCGDGASSVTIAGSVVGGMGNSSAMVNLNGVIKSLTIGGDLIGGAGDSSGSVRGGFQKIVVGGSLVGGGGTQSGTLFATMAQDVTVYGSSLGGSGEFSGLLFANYYISGKVAIHGDIVGGMGKNSGGLWVDSTAPTNPLGSFWVGGSVVGGSGEDSGAIRLDGQAKSLHVGGDVVGGSTVGAGSIRVYGGDSLTVQGDIIGGSTNNTGYVHSTSDDTLKSLKIGGSLIGGTANSTGYVGVSGDLGIGSVGGNFEGTNDRTNTARFTVVGDVTGKLSIGGSLFGADRTISSAHLDVQGYAKEISISGSIIGGAANNGVDTYINSGSVTVGSAGKITLQGSLIGGHQSGGSEVQNHGAIRVAKTIDSLVIKGNVERGAGAGGVVALITAGGDYQAGDKSNLAFGNILIGGSVKQGMILSGYGLTGTGLNGSGAVANGSTAQIGNVTVNGNWITSTLAAGATTGATIYFSSATTTLLPAVAGSDIQASVASMVVKGSLQGTMGANTNGVVAERFLKFSVGGLDITPGPGSFNEHFGSMNYGMRWQQTSVHAA